MNAKKSSKVYLNGKEVPLFDIDSLLEGYEPTKEPNPWKELDDDLPPSKDLY